MLAVTSKRSEGRVSNPRLPVCATKPVKVSPCRRPAERISRRSREHRPTIGVLEPPQVTPMCLLGASRWHGGPSSIEQRVSRLGNQQGLLGARRGRRPNAGPTLNWCRVRKSSCCYESSGLLPLGHMPCGACVERLLANAHAVRAAIWSVARCALDWLLKVHTPFWSEASFYVRRTVDLAGISHALHQ